MMNIGFVDLFNGEATLDINLDVIDTDALWTLTQALQSVADKGINRVVLRPDSPLFARLFRFHFERFGEKGLKMGVQSVECHLKDNGEIAVEFTVSDEETLYVSDNNLLFRIGNDGSLGYHDGSFGEDYRPEDFKKVVPA